jgi:two-component system response regulator HydG
MRLTEMGTLVKSNTLTVGEEPPAYGTAAPLPTTLDEWARFAISQQNTQLADVEDALVNAALAEAGGNISKAASLLGLTRAQLDYRVKRNGRV